MNTLKTNQTALQRNLKDALIRFSMNRLNVEQANLLSASLLETTDFNDKILSHKGINWFAKEVIDSIDFDKLTR